MCLLARDRAGAGRSSLQMNVCAVFFCSEAQNVWLCPGSAAGGSSDYFFFIWKLKSEREKRISYLM
jgi:hypothetical protein